MADRTELPQGNIHKGRTPVVELREIARGLEQYAYLKGDNLMKAAATRIKEVAQYLENAEQRKGKS